MFQKLKAFTMAEAILVMTILGIIATIMISTLKPAEYKEKALQTMAKKVMSELDVATTQIIMNDSIDGSFLNLKKADGSENIDVTDPDRAQIHVANLYKKYLTAIRRTPSVKYWGYPKLYDAPIFDIGAQEASFVLKDGASVCIYGMWGVDSREGPTVFPGETTLTHSYIDSRNGYYVVFDTNDGEGPNVWGKDRFAFMIGPNGIAYEAKEGKAHEECSVCVNACWDDPSSCSCSAENSACFLSYCSADLGIDCAAHR